METVVGRYGDLEMPELLKETAEPFRFDVGRAPNRHLAFGSGVHFCLGAALARMEIRVVLQEVLRRMPDMEYAAGGPVLKPSSLVRSCVEMKVKYTPER